MKIGCDIEENNRFEKNLEDDFKFLNRIFTKNELDYCFSKKNSSAHLCARFCAKEALIKALGDKKIPLNKIEVLNEIDGKPFINLIDNDFEGKIELTLSHCENYSTAFVVVY